MKSTPALHYEGREFDPTVPHGIHKFMVTGQFGTGQNGTDITVPDNTVPGQFGTGQNGTRTYRYLDIMVPGQNGTRTIWYWTKWYHL